MCCSGVSSGARCGARGRRRRADAAGLAAQVAAIRKISELRTPSSTNWRSGVDWRGVCYARRVCLACYSDSAPLRPRNRYGFAQVGCTSWTSSGGWQLACPVGCLPFLYAPAESTRRALLAQVGRVCVARSFGKHDCRTWTHSLPVIRAAAFAPWIRASSGAKAQGLVRVPCGCFTCKAHPLIDNRWASPRVSSVSRTLDPGAGGAAMPDQLAGNRHSRQTLPPAAQRSAPYSACAQ